MLDARPPLRLIAPIALIGLLIGTTTADAARPAILHRVRPTVELVGIVFRLAEVKEYSAPADGNALRTAADAHFGEFRDHPAVLLARRLADERGIRYDAPMSLAVHINNTRNFSLAAPLAPWPAELDTRWDRPSVEEFMTQLEDFAKVSGFNDWFAEQRPAFDALVTSASEGLLQALDLPWFRSRLGLHPAGPISIAFSPIAGKHAYATRVDRSEGVAIEPVIGVMTDTIGDLERSGVIDTIVHELCHPTVNPAVVALADEFRLAGEIFFPLLEVNMAAIAYGTWTVTWQETVVRAYTAQWILDHRGPTAQKEFLNQQAALGFELTRFVQRKLSRHLRRQRVVPSRPVETFLKSIAEEVETLAKHERDEVSPKRPKLLSITPAPGTIDAGETTFRLEFDRPMAVGYSLMIADAEFPTVVAPPSWDETKKILTCTLRFEVGKSYAIGINGPGHGKFRAAEGHSLAAMVARYSTAAVAAGDAPTIVSLFPDGKSDVAPGRTMLRIAFDRPMRDSFSVTGGGPTFPKVIGEPRWNEDRTIFTLPIELEADRPYEFGINGPNHDGFQSRGGVAVKAQWIEFRTKAGE